MFKEHEKIMCVLFFHPDFTVATEITSVPAPLVLAEFNRRSGISPCPRRLVI